MAERRVLAIRGATTTDADTPDRVREVTRELLSQLVAKNALRTSDVISAIFTVTSDVRSEFPARAARELGWNDVPLLCVVEIDVPGSLARCIRVLLHVESSLSRHEVSHVYLEGARVLRPDLLRD